MIEGKIGSERCILSVSSLASIPSEALYYDVFNTLKSWAKAPRALKETKKQEDEVSSRMKLFSIERGGNKDARVRRLMGSLLLIYSLPIKRVCLCTFLRASRCEQTQLCRP